MIGMIGGFMFFACLAGGFLFLPKETKVFVVAMFLAAPFYIPVITWAFTRIQITAQVVENPDIEVPGLFSDPAIARNILISIAIFVAVIVSEQLYSRIKMRKKDGNNEQKRNNQNIG